MTQNIPNKDMPKAYNPKLSEQRIYKFWMNGGYFTPEIDLSKKPFVLIMPPPNVTGELHMGHALTVALEDLMVRWNRMLGKPTLYLPGTDHAGIATQVVVERHLAKNNITRHDLGREKFVEEIWEWVGQYGGRIYEQLKRLGASCDWTKQCFTLDDMPSKAVRTTFVNLYKKGLIYRGERIVNRCPRCATTLSDLEVKHTEENANLYHLIYPLEDNQKTIVVATTRPETMLGDTAVAVNPKDERYSTMIGQNVVLPIANRLIPIIADDAVDLEFGTGALKVTPGHDSNDFDIGERHNIDVINVMNLDGTMNENAGHYNGIDRFEARKSIIEELQSKNLLEKIVPHHHSVGHCDRCGDIVEPIISKQWYMKMKPLAKPAIETVKNGSINIVPKHFSKIYFNWMENIRDWPISRQLWWGHRIPVWYCQECDEIISEHDDPTLCTNCSSTDLIRDPDVLDTWFSSALWPHSTLGWPNKTDELKYFHPTSVLETGHDILFFWVARMIMMGIENTSEIPFNTVYLHGLVRDPEGVKMSKTKGNVMDPLTLIDTYGADALRFALTIGNSPGNDMRLNESKIEASRNFANKLWNASRYVMSKIESTDSSNNLENWPPEPTHLEDRWIFSRLNNTTAQVNQFMKDYQFGEAQRIIHDFLWNEFCDWYLEMSKVRISNDDQTPIPILTYVLEKTLRLLHPFMPFITEEIWRKLILNLPQDDTLPSALMIASYPEENPDMSDQIAETQVGAIIEMIRAIRNLRAEFRIQPNQEIEAIVDAPEILSVIQLETNAICSLAQINPLTVTPSRIREIKSDSAQNVSLVLSKGTITIPLGNIVNIADEKLRLSEEMLEISTNLDTLSKRLANKEFLTKAPSEVIEKEKQRQDNMKNRLERINKTLSRLG